jgi:rhodanese-related sulfurtransferase
MADLPPACPIPRWQLLKQRLQNVDAVTFNQLRAEGNHQLIDVRTDDEFAAFHLPEATSMNYLGATFLEQLEQLNPNQTYLVYCRSGRRSVRACTLMKSVGINNIIHLDGGLNNWEAGENKTN